MAEKTNISRFNKEEVFEKECRPILDELSKKLHLYNIPFIFSCCVANDESSSRFVNETSGAAARGLVLYDDRIAKHLGVIMGLDVTVRDEMEMELASGIDDDLFDIEF